MGATCSKCKKTKTADEMGRNRSRPNGLHHWCLACRREQNNARNRSRPKPVRSALYRRRKYGISPEEQQRLWERQSGKCAICKHRDAVCMDHCHGTGRVRGLLCRDCNTLLRALDTWPHRERAERYLKSGPKRATA